MTTIEWFKRVTAGDSVNAAANAANLNQPTLSRQVHAGALSPESIVAIARAYDADPIEGLIISGLVTEDDVRKHGAEVLIEHLSDRLLADEVWNRMQDGRVVERTDSADAEIVPFPRIVTNDEVRKASRKKAAKTDPNWESETDQ